MGAGLVSETYQVMRDGAAYALQGGGGHPADFGLDHCVGGAGAGGGSAARILRRRLCTPMPERGVLVTRWIKGRPWTSARGAERSRTSQGLADLLRRVHASPVPAPARAAEPVHMDRDLSCGAFARGRTDAADPALQDRRIGAQLGWHEPAAALPGVVCHSDLHAQNLIEAR